MTGPLACQGNRLLQLKNPWSHQRWKGNFSEKDDHWTPELRSALHFDQMQAIREDNGVWAMAVRVGVVRWGMIRWEWSGRA